MWVSINKKENQCEHKFYLIRLECINFCLGWFLFYFYWTQHIWFDNRIKEKQFKKKDHDVQINIQRQTNKNIDLH